MTYSPWATLRRNAFLLTIVLSALLFCPPTAFSKREHLVYFPNTAYELNIYKIYGKNPGKTLMLVGGIQGNEPGGFLSADLYADMSLEKGNLIVVPRANFNSIILNQRGANGDMNRKFTHEDAANSIEDKIVTILKRLISESDYLLNLHDGAGYYYPRYLNKWRNPKRFGQSIIADCREYSVPNSDRVIRLEEMAEKVIREVNAHIQNDLYKFHFMNTRTGENESPHREQRRSATYYALTRHHIPAFGVETSKFLPSIDLKVRYHNLVINAFKKLFGIIPESPGLVLDPPILKYLVVSINGRIPIVVNENQSLELTNGDSIRVTHIEANYERGLSLDILGYGGLNDYRKDFGIFRDTSLIVRKDNQKFAEIPIRMTAQRTGENIETGRSGKIDYFIIETKGERVLVGNEETLQVVRGDKLRIMDVLPGLSPTSGISINFKGFVGDVKKNTGEDRGFLIDTSSDLMKRFSLGKKGKAYEVIASNDKDVFGRMVVRLVEPKLDYMVLRVNTHRYHLLRPADTVSVTPRDEICFEAVQTNLFNKHGIHLKINGHRLNLGEAKALTDICRRSGKTRHEVMIKHGPLLLGSIYLHVKL